MTDQKQIVEAIADALALPTADIDPESHLQDDLGLNAVEIADLLDNLSRRFNIIIEPTEVAHIKTVNDLIEMIEDKSLE